MTTALATGCAGEELLVEPGEPEDDIGKADGSDEVRVELKLTIADFDIGYARSALGLRDKVAEKRDIWFYDTWSLDQLAAGAILRARKIDGDDDDSTVKLRPLTSDDVDPVWFTIEGFKCEIDRSVDAENPSCSLTVTQDPGEIDDVGDGERTIDKLFSDDQERLLADHGTGVDFADLVALGPIPARVWTVRTDALETKVTAELWDMPDGEQVLELSTKVAIDDADDAARDFALWVDDHYIELATDQETKTRRALELLTGVGY